MQEKYQGRYSSVPETQEHIKKVYENISKVMVELMARAKQHDQTKMKHGEVEYFDEYTPMLASCTYGSDEYKQFLKNLEPALIHHYAMNRHHPEHFENGIKGMNLIDILEMFCDWYAATKRHNDGDIMRSIKINQERFNYSDDLKAIFENTFNDIFVENPNG